MDKEQLTNINNMKPPIDHFTDAAAILNQLDLRSIIGCPGGMITIKYTRSIFTHAFRANFSLRFPRKRL